MRGRDDQSRMLNGAAGLWVERADMSHSVEDLVRKLRVEPLSLHQCFCVMEQAVDRRG